MSNTKSPLSPVIDALEPAAPLDAPGKKIAAQVRGLLGPGALKDGLSGTWLGHALHPLLTDLVIGSFVSATVLDVIGGDDRGRAQERLIGVGIASYAPTAITGISDWADSEPAGDGIRRVGLVHAATNSVALSLYTASLVARRKGNPGRGKLLGFGGAAVLGAAGLLGGHLSYAQGVGPNQTAFDEGPADWTPVGEAADLVEGQPVRVVADETPVFLLKHADGLHALHDRCSHRGCSLSSKGTLDGEVVECNCHGSRFNLHDGSLLRGPATTDQPSFEVRESAGTIEVRLPEQS